MVFLSTTYTREFQLFCTFQLPTGMLLIAVQDKWSIVPYEVHKEVLSMSLNNPKAVPYWNSSCSGISSKHPWGQGLPKMLANRTIWKRICLHYKKLLCFKLYCKQVAQPRRTYRTDKALILRTHPSWRGSHFSKTHWETIQNNMAGIPPTLKMWELFIPVTR